MLHDVSCLYGNVIKLLTDTRFTDRRVATSSNQNRIRPLASSTGDTRPLPRSPVHDSQELVGEGFG
jgi:hypothetical protein